MDNAKVIAWKKADRAKLARQIANMPKRKKRAGRGPSGSRRAKKGRKGKNTRKSRDILKLDSNGYPVRFWTRALRHHVRGLFGWQCGWCGDKQRGLEEGEWLHVHHKDKNKRNCWIENLVPLCPDCHTLIAHSGHYSDLRGDELAAAITRQKAKIAAYKAYRRERKVIDAEREQESLARGMGLTPDP